ncbi:MAG: sigma-70 family RNA polymerase sigma factor [Chloroflexota bacterium]
MSKYDPTFWEVNVDPQVLESVLIAPDLLEEILRDEDDTQASQEKARLKQSAIDQISQLIETQLTPKQRQIVELYFYENKTQQEIAQQLGINQQVVSKHLFGAVRNGRKVGGAIKKLRKLGEKLGIDPKKWV